MKDHKKTKSEELELEELFHDLNKLQLPIVKTEEKNNFKEDLKAHLLFEFSRRQQIANNPERRSFFERFFAIFKSALVTAVLMPLLVLGGVTGYAYSSPDVYAGHVLYPLKVSVEALEISIKKDPSDQVETKLKFAERKLMEVLAMKNDGKKIEGVTLQKVADYTLSALEDVKNIKEEKDKDYLKQKINQFSERQMESIASLSDGEILKTNNSYFTYENSASLPIFELEDSGGESTSGQEETQLMTGRSMLTQDNPESADSEDIEVAYEITDSAITSSASGVSEEQIIDIQEIKQESAFSENDSLKVADTTSSKNTLAEMKEIASEVLKKEPVDVPSSVNLTRNGEKEALDYIWNVTNQIKTQEKSNSNSENMIQVTGSSGSLQEKQDESFLFHPRLKFIPSFEKHKFSKNEYLLQVKEPFSFSVYSFFIDSLNLEVPMSIYDNSIEVYFTQDNSDPFTSSTKMFYAKDQLLQVDRSMTFKFIATSNNQVSPVYTVQISFVNGMNEGTKELKNEGTITTPRLRKVNENNEKAKE